jgi:hypothetical protein
MVDVWLNVGVIVCVCVKVGVTDEVAVFVGEMVDV